MDKTTLTKNTPLVLLILDGWGISKPSRGNSITEANLEYFDYLLSNYKTFALAASGEAVGLPWGEPGNSEVGHQNIGAGKIVYQDVLKINKSIEDKSFFEQEKLMGAITHCKQHNSSLHIVGILSDGGIHGHQDHIYASLELASRNSLNRVFVHVILDGRDTSFDSGKEYVKQLEKITKRLKVGSIATISGRFWAMDRDNHWERVEKVYNAMTKAESEYSHESAQISIDSSYEQKVYDEEFVPTVIQNKVHPQQNQIQSGDSVIFTNYRPDRARELTQAFVLPGFNKFKRSLLGNLYFVTMTNYDNDLPVHVAYTKDTIEYPLARVLSDNGLTQLHVAETEKYAHVTYFFNGGKDVAFPKQENIIIPSKGTASYAETPEMSVNDITKTIVSSIENRKHDIIIANLANADMVGHTGDIRATIKGLRAIESSLKIITNYIVKAGGVLIITSDHGNAESMVNWENGHIVKEHSNNPVPCIIVGEQFKLAEHIEVHLHDLKVTGVLSDISPTMLSILGVSIPKQMTSRSLI